ncbi:hypothetical protein Tco_0144038 [Tanacetum coccineum]
MSLIHSFSNEDMYKPYYSKDYQNTAREDFPVEVAAPPLAPAQPKPSRRRQNRSTQNEEAPCCTAWTNEEEIALCKDEEEDEVKELARPIGWDKTKVSKKKWVGSSKSSSSVNDEALARMREPYNHLTGDALKQMEEIRARIKEK